jgi:3-hydroxyisobutyrate dehydrogenase-like beta-hydroxyacid dehydrogenase
VTLPRAGREGSRRRVGILFSGELGSALGGLLVARGVDVVTTAEGRSDRSATLATAAGMTVLSSVRDVLSAADYVVSAVPPAAAVRNAQSIASQLPADGRSRVFVDLNSIAPTTMLSVAAAFDGSGVCVLDAALHGQASTLGSTATLYVSGCGADGLSALIGAPPRVVVLGDRVGHASLFKMLLAGVNKGVVALMLELSQLAEREGVLDAFWAATRAAYPGVMEPFERLLPSYPTHVGRRAEEMGELEATVSAAGGTPIMAAAVRRTFEAAAASPGSLRALVEAAAADRDDGSAIEAVSAPGAHGVEILPASGPGSPSLR